MSYSMVSVVYGIPMTAEIAERIDEWEADPASPWEEGPGNMVCGFTKLYRASGPMSGYAGVQLCMLDSYGDDLVSNYRFTPTDEEVARAQALVDAVHPDLRALTGPIGVYFVWSDS